MAERLCWLGRGFTVIAHETEHINFAELGTFTVPEKRRSQSIQVSTDLTSQVWPGFT